MRRHYRIKRGPGHGDSTFRWIKVIPKAKVIDANCSSQVLVEAGKGNHWRRLKSRPLQTSKRKISGRSDDNSDSESDAGVARGQGWVPNLRSWHWSHDCESAEWIGLENDRQLVPKKRRCQGADGKNKSWSYYLFKGIEKCHHLLENSKPFKFDTIMNMKNL